MLVCWKGKRWEPVERREILTASSPNELRGYFFGSSRVGLGAGVSSSLARLLSGAVYLHSPVV